MFDQACDVKRKGVQGWHVFCTNTLRIFLPKVVLHTLYQHSKFIVGAED